MLTLAQAVREAQRLQAAINAPLRDVECSSVDDHVLAYLLFDHNWEVIAFRVSMFDREACEQEFIRACSYDSRGSTIH